ncbi:phosphonate ABC transporter ATP-binding protein [Marinithermus hydrothermalis]|uniref:Phosphonate ABC transporter, ATPase subunit n=1 Tax=Marinithermus hydrothermalis (strain DSM 14884 / JCM 11576 / T1) TaxID=869210 RepID=F2NKR1_MARHT|nr:phosphonate ABC transporter ATP-binding protein [Marinithermus hydrothermalis]AEB10824.1 phosphonate ABC transporter, ATPase subunit [Marinithermus hydrothermalis DSM 14884]
MIEVNRLTKIFPDGTRALSDVSVTIPDGDFVAIIGLSGAGKSTFLRCLNRLVDPTEGEVWVNGVNVAALKGAELRAYRRTVGFIFQQFNLVTRLTVLDNVLTGRLGYHPTWRGVLGLYREQDYAIARTYIRRVGLADKENTRVDQLSGGQQQRVAIARAMAQEPQLILADEPMASLDPRLSDVILGLLKEYNEEKGVTVLVNIHVLELARRYARRILAFNKGRLVFDGSVEELTPERAKEIYAGSLEAL